MTTDNTHQNLFDRAVEILDINDRGHYTVPTSGLYPFQWNWDSCLVSIGQQHVNEARAWKEISTLFEHQWDDGMVPHIVFHVHDDGYFPGPDVWATGREVPTTGITQPPVAGFAALKLFERAKKKELATQEASGLLAGIDRWHEWFYASRDPENTGLVALIHPWESGRDNSVDWDAALNRVPTDDVRPYQRRDLQHADATHRPTSDQYDRYIWLVQHFRNLAWDNARLHDASPFKVVDPGFNAILIRSCTDLATLADLLGDKETAQRNRQRAAAGLAAMESLWSEKLQQYTCYDRVSNSLVNSASVGGLIPVLAALPANRSEAIARRINALSESVHYLVPSHDPADSHYDTKRYWRGPCWLIVNYLIVDGLRYAEHTELAQRIEAASLALIRKSGFAEYYDPETGEPCGGSTFTWTAAMVMEFLRNAE
ncbi:MAG: trehalase family glycosidase [Granulosicoccus sp.]